MKKEKEEFVYVVTKWLSNDDTVVCGVYNDKKVAIDTANKIAKDYVEWVDKVAIPFKFYMDHINDFDKTPEYTKAHEEYIVNGTCFILYHKETYILKDYLGYTKDDWKEAHDLYFEHLNDAILYVEVMKWVIGEKTDSSFPTKKVFNTETQGREYMPIYDEEKGLVDSCEHKIYEF